MKRTYKKVLLVVFPLLLFGTGFGYWQYTQQQAKEKAAIARQEELKARAEREAKRTAQLPQQAEPVLPPFNKQQLSIDNPSSIWVVVNKRRPLVPQEYVPADLVTPDVPLRSSGSSPEMKLRAEAAAALETMTKAAKADGAQLMLASGYRSFTTQTAIYNREVRTYGQAVADSQSARPGHSEHQTGLGVDLAPVSRQCVIEDCFAETVEGKWLAANAAKFGFLLRYTVDKTSVTGYRAESWHFRYVGTALSAEIQKHGIITLEEFFGLPSAPDYGS